MPPLLRFLIRRLIAIPVTLLIITAALYAITLIAPAEVRAQLYLTRTELTRGNVPELSRQAVQRYGLDDPYPVQYARWIVRVAQGDWGFSPTLHDEVLDALLARTPVTAELTLYSLLVFIPLGLVTGVQAGWSHDRTLDHGVRGLAFAGMAVPPFVLGLVLLALFYAGLHWFPPERLGMAATQVVRSAGYHAYTGLLTVDGLLNGRPDVTLDALQHLVLPVLTLSVAHWATLARVARVATMGELHKEYLVAAQARGLKQRSILWRHAFPNAAGPALTSSALATTSLLTGVFVVEVIFGLHGISEILTSWARDPAAALRIPDTAAVLGFAVYSVLAVQAVMLVLDLMQALLDPRVREGLGDRA